MRAFLPVRARAESTRATRSAVVAVAFERDQPIGCCGCRSPGRTAQLLEPFQTRRPTVILRIDRWLTELPPPADPDPDGASIVQELMGGKFGEMSTLMNYTFQSFNFRNRQGARPFYDLIANIAAEEYGHIELVAAAINTMLTGADTKGARPRNAQQFIAGG